MIEPEDALRAVADDVSAALQDQLPGGEGFAPAEDFSELDHDPLANAERTAVVVPWTWQGLNENLLGLSRTGRAVTVRGVTIVTEGDGELLCQRFVDWLPALSEAGVVLYTRPIVDIRTVYSEEELRQTPELADAFDEIDSIRADFDL